MTFIHVNKKSFLILFLLCLIISFACRQHQEETTVQPASASVNKDSLKAVLHDSLNIVLEQLDSMSGIANPSLKQNEIMERLRENAYRMDSCMDELNGEGYYMR